MSRVTVLEVFPGHFDQNGDSGNSLALRRRLEWSGFDVERVAVEVREPWPVAAPDFVLVGGGSIPAQRDALESLVEQRGRLADWIAGGSAYLAVAGGYVLSATGLVLPGDASEDEGLGVFAGRGTALDALASGPLSVRSPRYGVLHGYVNLAQRVVLDDPSQSLGAIDVAPWQGSTGGPEGAEVGPAFGSHAHGPIVPKNPEFADAFIRAGLARRGLAGAYLPGVQHAYVDALALRARASLAQRLSQSAPD